MKKKVKIQETNPPLVSNDNTLFRSKIVAACFAIVTVIIIITLIDAGL